VSCFLRGVLEVAVALQHLCRKEECWEGSPARRVAWPTV
jgi:hypothetical protein